MSHANAVYLEVPFATAAAAPKRNSLAWQLSALERESDLIFENIDENAGCAIGVLKALGCEPNTNQRTRRRLFIGVVCQQTQARFVFTKKCLQASLPTCGRTWRQPFAQIDNDQTKGATTCKPLGAAHGSKCGQRWWNVHHDQRAYVDTRARKVGRIQCASLGLNPNDRFPDALRMDHERHR